MKRVSLFCAVAAAAALMVPAARADEFTITFTGDPGFFSGSGVFDATLSGGVYTVTGVESGSVTDSFFGTSTITTLDPIFGAPDQEFTLPSMTYFDPSGLSFDLANGLAVNLYTDSASGASSEARSDGESELVTDTITPFVPAAATPEPSSIMLLGSGLLGVGGMIRRRQSVA